MRINVIVDFLLLLFFRDLVVKGALDVQQPKGRCDEAHHVGWSKDKSSKYWWVDGVDGGKEGASLH